MEGNRRTTRLLLKSLTSAQSLSSDKELKKKNGNGKSINGLLMIANNSERGGDGPSAIW